MIVVMQDTHHTGDHHTGHETAQIVTLLIIVEMQDSHHTGSITAYHHTGHETVKNS